MPVARAGATGLHCRLQRLGCFEDELEDLG